MKFPILKISGKAYISDRFPICMSKDMKMMTPRPFARLERSPLSQTLLFAVREVKRDDDTNFFCPSVGGFDNITRLFSEPCTLYQQYERSKVKWFSWERPFSTHSLYYTTEEKRGIDNTAFNCSVYYPVHI